MYLSTLSARHDVNWSVLPPSVTVTLSFGMVDIITWVVPEAEADELRGRSAAAAREAFVAAKLEEMFVAATVWQAQAAQVHAASKRS